MSDPKPRLRRWRRVFLVAGSLIVLGLAERGVRLFVSYQILATQGAAWIWAPDSLDRTDGIAFYAVRDFDLSEVPSDARIHLLADEEYIAYLNGTRFGSGIYYVGAELDAYEVGSLLRPGNNRLAVELRSDRGAGGLLLTLTDGLDGRLIVGSGDDWRIFERADGAIGCSRPTGESVPAMVWQSPPHGGWGAPGQGPIRRGFASATAGHRRRQAVSTRKIREEPKIPGGPGRNGVLVDFGEPVTGYLMLLGLSRGPRRMLMSIGTEKGELDDLFRANRVPGQDHWSQAESSTFRYVRLWGALPDTLEPTVLTVTKDLAAEDAARRIERRKGVFGLPVPPS